MSDPRCVEIKDKEKILEYVITTIKILCIRLVYDERHSYVVNNQSNITSIYKDMFSDGYTVQEIVMEWTNPNISNPTATDENIEIAEFDLGKVTPYDCTVGYSTGMTFRYA